MITCERCGKLVDWVESWYDLLMCVTRYRAHCHGEIEECFITDQDKAEVGPEIRDMLRVGVAFRQTPKLTALDKGQ